MRRQNGLQWMCTTPAGAMWINTKATTERDYGAAVRNVFKGERDGIAVQGWGYGATGSSCIAGE